MPLSPVSGVSSIQLKSQPQRFSVFPLDLHVMHRDFPRVLLEFLGKSRPPYPALPGSGLACDRGRSVPGPVRFRFRVAHGAPVSSATFRLPFRIRGRYAFALLPCSCISFASDPSRAAKFGCFSLHRRWIPVGR